MIGMRSRAATFSSFLAGVVCGPEPMGEATVVSPVGPGLACGGSLPVDCVSPGLVLPPGAVAPCAVSYGPVLPGGCVCAAAGNANASVATRASAGTRQDSITGMTVSLGCQTG